MSTASPTSRSLYPNAPQYAGLRLSADEYLDLPNDRFRYELINGVVVLSPSPTPQHQSVVNEIAFQITAYLKQHPVGRVFPETDVRFDDDLVYCPELVFLRAERVLDNWQRIHEPPDMAVEVISPGSLRYDSETKRSDYERFGVYEYWLIDPERETMMFFRLAKGKYVEITPVDDRFTSEAVKGFMLDLTSVRKSFHPQ